MSTTSQTTASLYVQDEAGTTLLSQVSQAITLDYRDSKVDPHQRLGRRGSAPTSPGWAATRTSCAPRSTAPTTSRSTG